MAEATAGKVATLEQLRRPEPSSLPNVRMGWNDSAGFELMQRAARALAASDLVPTQFQGNIPNCLIALDMAQRIGASPLMVCQNLYVVHGRPGWSAKFLIASMNQCGRFTAIRFDWQGTRGNDDWGCRAWAVEKSTEEKIIGPAITIDLAKQEGWYNKSGSKWKTIPELMLMYRAAAWMINTHAPEISMGLNTAEELADVYDATRGDDGSFGVTLDTLRQEHAAVADTTDKATGEIKPPIPAPIADSGFEPAANAPDPRKPKGYAVTFAEVASAIKAAGDAESLALAADLVRGVADAGHRAELEVEVLARRKALAK